MYRPVFKISCTVSFMLALCVTAPAAEKLPVFVSILPQKYFVHRIGGDLVSVQVMVQPGSNPATYEPKPRQMAALAKTRLYFSIGVPFEQAWLKKIAASSPKMTVVPTDEGIRKFPMAEHDHADKAVHGDSDKPHPQGMDPHIWLSPLLVRQQAAIILNALQQADPKNRPAFTENYNAFIADVMKLDSELKLIFANRQKLCFMVFHPSWGYFARDYNLKQVPIEIEGKHPKPAQLEKLVAFARKQQIRVVFVQPQFSSRSAKLIAREIGGKVSFADPLAEDWLGNLRKVAREFEAVLK